ncbi:MAG: UBP-type zinc finger domain-containing protein [Jannaschia sp.]
MSSCTHGDRVAVPPLAEGEKTGLTCPACVAAGDTWVHLRQCRVCGAVGCCDDSKNRHARAHAEGEDHPIITSAEPGERWSWCYIDKTALSLRG